MTSTTERAILLHRVPDDPVRSKVAEALKTATYLGHGDSLGDMLRYAADQAGISHADAEIALGLRVGDMDPWRWEGEVFTTTYRPVIPDGIRACYRDECKHGPGYVPDASPVRQRLTAEAARKPVRQFRQYDGWVPLERFANDCVTGSTDGTSPKITSTLADELRNGTPVRVQIAMDVAPEDTVLALRTIADLIEHDGRFAVDEFADLDLAKPPF